MVTPNKKETLIGHIECMLADPEFIARYNTLADNKGARRALLEEFGVSLDKLDGFDLPYAKFLNPDIIFSAGTLKYDVSTEKFTANIDLDVTGKQMTELFKLIEVIRKKQTSYHRTKKRGPERPALLYAIHRARARGLTFPQVFNDYKDGKLPHVKLVHANQFKTPKDLSDYYYRRYNHI